MGAIYKGLQFKTALEARWAAFFDLAGWEWHVNPVCVGDWSPDFCVVTRNVVHTRYLFPFYLLIILKIIIITQA